MSKVRVAINGFGRVGRAVFKVLRARGDCEVVAINDLADNDTVAYALKHDTLYGAYGRTVTSDEAGILVDNEHVRVLTQPAIANLPWDGMDIDVVVEATGTAHSAEHASAHIKAGAKKVIVTAALPDSKLIVLGANDDSLRSAENVISMGTSGVNALAPLIKAVTNAFHIEALHVTIMQGPANDQPLLDRLQGGHVRANRAGNTNIVPLESSFSSALGTLGINTPVLAQEYRMPVAGAALAQITFTNSGSEITAEAINAAIKTAATQPFYQGIIGVTDEELVSNDFTGNPYSCVVDTKLTAAQNTIGTIVAWYDSEWSYANRVAELAVEAGRNT